MEEREISGFDELLKRYKEKNPAEADTVEEALENGDIGEMEFIMSKFAGESMPGLHDDAAKYSDKITYITELCDDNVSGIACNQSGSI